MRVDRRRALALFGFGAAAQAASTAMAAQPGKVAFNHGVASGDPTQDSVVLWTRVTPENAATSEVAFKWRLDPVDRRAGGAKSGVGVTGPDRDFTVKVDVGGLEPGRAYTFQFEAGGATSPLGRTRTLPAGPVKDVVMAVASCALFPNGYFNAYQAIADLPRVDVVLHLGDYIYEYGGPGSYGMSSPVAEARRHDPFREIVSLDDYRRRHAQYKADPQLQAAHAKAPWITVWDDHETANDSWREGAENHDPATEGDWNARKAAALKAYFEWMPIREPAGGMREAINRSFHFGDLASLIMIETRLTARDHQLSYGEDLPNQEPATLEAFRAKLADPSRKMMGEGQHAWVAGEVKRSIAAGHAWQVLGNEVVMARLAVPSLRAATDPATYDAAVAKLPKYEQGYVARLEKAAALGLPWGLDMWDGYPADRQRLYDDLSAPGARPVVLAGDSHCFWANELYDAPEGGRRVAVEFGTTGITSPGAADVLGGLPADKGFVDTNREVLYANSGAKGFVLLTLDREQVKGEMMAVSTITEKTFTVAPVKTFIAKAEPNGVSGLTEV